MEYNVKGKSLSLDISLLMGDILIKRSEGKAVSVEFPDLRKGALEAFMDVEYSEKEGLKIREKKNGLVMGSTGASDLVLSLPDLPAEGMIRLDKGDCIVDGPLVFTGKAEIRMGDLVFRQSLEGDLSARVIKGDLVINEMNGALSAVTVNGDIMVRNGRLTGMNCKTVAGDISVTGDFAPVQPMRAVSVSGDIHLNALHYEGSHEVTASSVSGDVNIEGAVPEEKKKAARMEHVMGGKGIFSVMKLLKTFPFKRGEEPQVEVRKKESATGMNVDMVLNMLDEGRITAKQAEKLIRALKE
jgi:hypothetical protein